VRLKFRLPLSDGKTIAMVHALGRVIQSRVDDSAMAIEADVPASVARRLKLDSAGRATI